MATRSSLVVLENIAADQKDLDRAYYFEKAIRDIILPVVKEK